MIPLRNQIGPLRRHRVLTVTVTILLLFMLVWAFVKFERRSSVTQSADLPIDLKEWRQFDGVWSGDGQVISNLRNGRGDKLISKRTVPDDLVFSGEIRFDSESDMQWGDTGLLIRATNVARGTDALNGYYVGLRPFSRELVLGRESNDFVNLSVRPLSEPLELGAWYKLQISVRGCRIESRAQNMRGEEIGTANFDDRGCDTKAGTVGLRSYSMLTSWRHLHVQAAS